MVRPFAVRYNPYTEMIEVLNKKETVVRFASNIRADMKVCGLCLWAHPLRSVHAHGS